MANIRQSLLLSDDQLEDLASQFHTIDVNGDGYLEVSELQGALHMVGFKVPQYQIRNMLDEYSKQYPNLRRTGKITLSEFKEIFTDLKSKEVASTFKVAVSKKRNLETLGGMSEASSEGTTHSVRHEEQVAFSDWINLNLGHDPDLHHLLPIDTEGKTLYDRIKDGILLCKVINFSCPDTIDERAINKKNLTVYTKHENLTLALNSARAIGCNVINIDTHDLSKGKPHLVLGLVWQVIRVGLFSHITLEQCPGLARLLEDGETLEDLMKLSPESILIRWVNYHLKNSETDRRLRNFTSDVKDSVIYTYLLKQIAPADAGVHMHALKEKDELQRAEIMLQQADKLHCRSFLAPKDVVRGVYKLNLAFVANLFNNHPALDDPEDLIEIMEYTEETREERTYRNWMNSMGVDPYVNHLYNDLADGLIIFQLYDVIRPDFVNRTRIHKQFSKMKKFMEKIENCNYAVELGKDMGFSLVGVAGQDISDGNKTLTLALVWQLMRAYTLSILTQLSGQGKTVGEKEIIEWVNNKLTSAGKSSRIRSFQDSSIADSVVVLDLIDAINPGTVNYDVVRRDISDNSRMANAKYAISMARKIGAKIYALPEDITEVKPKMVMTVFACLMARDYVPNMGSKSDGHMG